MASYTVLNNVLQAPPKDWVPTYPASPYGVINSTDEAIEIPSLKNGATATANPVTVSSGPTVTAANIESFKDIYYNAVYFVPATITKTDPDVGELFSFEVWNAFFATTTTLTRTDTDALATANTYLSGEVFQELQLKEFTVNLNQSSLVDINAEYLYTFDTVVDALFRFNALVQIPQQLLSTEPEKSFNQRLEYHTDIIKSVDGTEQRISYLTAPVETIDLELRYVDESQFRDLRSWLANRLDLPVYVPVWYEGVLGRSDYHKDDTIINEDFSLLNLAKADYVYIADRANAVGELKQILSVNNNEITLTTALNNDYKARRFYIYPTRPYTHAKNQKIQRLAWEGGTIPISLVGRERNMLTDNKAPAFTLFNGRPVLESRPTVETTIDESFNNRQKVFDFGGKVLIAANQSYSDIQQSRTYRSNSRLEWQYWKAFLNEVAGQRNTFYAPTWRDDLVPVDYFESTSLLVVAPLSKPEYLNEYFERESHKHLQITTLAGTFYLTIDDSTKNANDEYELELSPPIPNVNDVSQILSISFLLKLRLASDTVDIIHYPTYSEIALVTRTVEDS